MKRFAVSPVAFQDIKKGKNYPITEWNPSDGIGSFHIDINGHNAYCLIGAGCAHIGNERWTIIEEEEPSDG